MRRSPQESIAQLLVREEELFVELQQSLQRARQEREPGVMPRPATEPPPMSASPSQSPTAGPPMGTASTWQSVPLDASSSTTTAGGFFEDEMRGYRLLKAAKLSTADKQYVLTLTKNSTQYFAIRRALRTLFADGDTVDDVRVKKAHGMQKNGMKIGMVIGMNGRRRKMSTGQTMEMDGVKMDGPVGTLGTMTGTKLHLQHLL